MDDNTFKLLSLFLGSATTVLLAWVTYLTAKARGAVQEVKSTLATTTTNTDNKLNQIHVLVDGNLTRLEQVLAKAQKQVLDLSVDAEHTASTPTGPTEVVIVGTATTVPVVVKEDSLDAGNSTS